MSGKLRPLSIARAAMMTYIERRLSSEVSAMVRMPPSTASAAMIHANIIYSRERPRRASLIPVGNTVSSSVSFFDRSHSTTAAATIRSGSRMLRMLGFIKPVSVSRATCICSHRKNAPNAPNAHV